MTKKRLLSVLLLAAVVLWAPRVLYAARAWRHRQPLRTADYGGVPTIHISAINDHRGLRCITCEAGQLPCVVAFVRQRDKDTKQLMSALDKAYREHNAQGLRGGIVVLGDGAAAKELIAYATKHQFQIPTAQLAADAYEVTIWAPDGEAGSTVYFINHHVLRHREVAPGPATVADRLSEIMPAKGQG